MWKLNAVTLSPSPRAAGGQSLSRCRTTVCCPEKREQLWKVNWPELQRISSQVERSTCTHRGDTVYGPASRPHMLWGDRAAAEVCGCQRLPTAATGRVQRVLGAGLLRSGRKHPESRRDGSQRWREGPCLWIVQMWFLKLAVCRAIQSEPADTASTPEQALRRRRDGAWCLAHERLRLFLCPEDAGLVFPSKCHMLIKSTGSRWPARYHCCWLNTVTHQLCAGNLVK